jgi:uncharacterized SAM-binding protein YcdF (DUF218 family)
MDKADQHAIVIYDYMQLHQTLQKSDTLFVLCSYDTRVAVYAAELFNQGLAPWMIISGGSGELTEHLFSEPEADVFATIAIKAGVPKDKIIIERTSTNTGENVRFTHALLKELGKDFTSFILIQKPYMERRSFATFVKQWPGNNINVQVSSPRLTYKEWFDNSEDKQLSIRTMVGDLQRIKEYPALGFQIEQAIPADVWVAYEALVAMGYRQHLL